jgi:DNA invertase Pin-like site-specific DNA recombinase
MDKIKVGIYCRISTSNQTKNTSLLSQKLLGIEYCEMNDYEYEVFEEVESGGKYEREEFLLLENKVKNGEIKGVWVYDNDRLSRDVGVGQKISKLITDNKCKLFIRFDEVKLEVSSDRFGYNIRSVMSDYERMRIKERMDIGKGRLIKDGGKLGNVGLGYKREKGSVKIFIDVEESKIVKDIFKLYLHKSVKSYGDTFRRLESKYKEKLKGKISSSSVGRILNDRKYLGVYKGFLEGVEYELNIGRIVSDEDFEKVKKKIIYCKGLRKSNVVEEYLLKGKVRCNDCNENMWILGGSDGVSNKKYKYYYCGRDKKNERGLKRGDEITEKCLSSINLNNKINRDKLEDIVWNVLFKILNNSDEVKKEYNNRWNNDKGSKDRFSANLWHLNEKLNGFKEKLIISTKKNIEGLIDDNIYREVKSRYEKDVKDIQNEINKLNEEKNKSENIESIDGYLELMRSDLDRDIKIDRFKDKRRIIEKYIESIKVKYIRKINNYKEYDIVLNMFLNDKDLIGDKREIVIDNDKNKYNFYILKFKSSQIQFLIYKEFTFQINCKILIRCDGRLILNSSYIIQ